MFTTAAEIWYKPQVLTECDKLNIFPFIIVYSAMTAYLVINSLNSTVMVAY